MTGGPARRRLRRLGAAGSLALVLSGCSLVGLGDDGAGTSPASPTEATVDPLEVDSTFTTNGTFQAHDTARGLRDLDFVYTMYPTQATPRTGEWYPRGKKYFTFTFQAYDLAQQIRAPFATKRRVYLDTIKVTSRTITADGGRTERPYRLDAEAKEITLDPEPTGNRFGMLITSPKGAFELRNQVIGSMSEDTRGVELTFTAVVHAETSAGSGDYERRAIKQVVPISIFASDTPTRAARVPVDAG